MLNMSYQDCVELPLGGVTIQVAPWEAAVVVFTTKAFHNHSIILQANNDEPFQRPVTTRFVNGETLYAAVFSTVVPGQYTLRWENKATQITVEKGKITQVGLGVRAAYPTRTIKKAVPLPAHEPVEEDTEKLEPERQE